MVHKTIAFFLSLFASVAVADDVFITASPGLVEIEMRFDQPEGDAKPPAVSWRTAYPILLDYKVRTAGCEGWSVLTFNALKGKKYAIDGQLIDWSAQELVQKRFVVTVKGDPDPTPPDPDPPGPDPPGPDPTPPDLDGLAKDVYEQAAKIEAEGHADIADVFQGVLDVIDTISPLIAHVRTAKGIKDLGLQRDRWQPFLDWLSGYLDANVQSRDDIKRDFPLIIKGLRYE